MAATVEIEVKATDSYSSDLGNFGSIKTVNESALNMAKKANDDIVVPVSEFWL
jgi:hypothetical protein